MEGYDSMLRGTLLNIQQIIQLLQGDLGKLVGEAETKTLREMTPEEAARFELRLRQARFTADCLSTTMMQALVSSSPTTGNSRTERETA